MVFGIKFVFTYMWIGYSLHGQGWRQRVLDGAWRGRGVCPEDDGVCPGAGVGAGPARLKIPSKPNCEWKPKQPQTLHSSSGGGTKEEQEEII